MVGGYGHRVARERRVRPGPARPDRERVNRAGGYRDGRVLGVLPAATTTAGVAVGQAVSPVAALAPGLDINAGDASRRGPRATGGKSLGGNETTPGISNAGGEA